MLRFFFSCCPFPAFLESLRSVYPEVSSKCSLNYCCHYFCECAQFCKQVGGNVFIYLSIYLFIYLLTYFLRCCPTTCARSCLSHMTLLPWRSTSGTMMMAQCPVRATCLISTNTYWIRSLKLSYAVKCPSQTAIPGHTSVSPPFLHACTLFFCCRWSKALL